MVFERFNAFLERLRTIQWFFNTVLEFSKLEKVEIGGIKGRNLSARVTVVFTEFQQCFSIFSGKSYDVLDPDDSSFISDFENFKKKIFEMDMKLAAILCQAFEDCSNLESIFKVWKGIIYEIFTLLWRFQLISIVGSVLERPLIKAEFTNKYTKILDMLRAEISTAEVCSHQNIFIVQTHFSSEDSTPIFWFYKYAKRQQNLLSLFNLYLQK